MPHAVPKCSFALLLAFVGPLAHGCITEDLDKAADDLDPRPRTAPEQEAVVEQRTNEGPNEEIESSQANTAGQGGEADDEAGIDAEHRSAESDPVAGEPAEDSDMDTGDADRTPIEENSDVDADDMEQPRMEADAQPIPGGDPEPGRLAGITAAHNAVRAGLDLPRLSWSSALATFAQQWADSLADDCDGLGHRDQDLYGENLALYGSWPEPPRSRPTDAVDSWAQEVACWDYGPFMTGDRCDMSCAADLNSTGCGHYTQVVWEATSAIGCGVAACDRDGFQIDIWVCNYDPPGNYVGQSPY